MHFTVLVVGEEPEDQLAPFQENNMGDCPKEFLEFTDLEDEIKEEYEKNKSFTKIKCPDGTLMWPWEIRDKENQPGYEEVQIPLQELYPTFKQFAEDYHGYRKDSRKKRYGYWENPNARWDWYQLGGRWTGFFKLKKGAEGAVGEPGLQTPMAKKGLVDQAYKGDIDWEGTKSHSREYARELWNKFMADTDPHRYFRYGINEGESREEFLNRLSQFSVFALLMDGEWSEGGWGDEDKSTWDLHIKSIIDSLPDDTLLSVYDCHM